MNLMNDGELATELQNRPGPTVTKEAIEARIADVAFSVLPKSTVTLCNITLDNGYSVRGESACVDPSNFDQAIGERIAYDNAFARLWPLLGFALAEAMHTAECTPVFTPADVAAICHEANRMLCLGQGDASHQDWAKAPAWQAESAHQGVLFHLDHPEASPSASHQSWLRAKEASGWQYGTKKDEDAKTHPCMVAFEDLPPEQQAKDHLFRGIVHALRPFVERD